MTKFRYIKKMHRELQRSAPDGFSVQVVREGKHLFTVISCFDPEYVAPWGINTIVESYGFSTVYA